MKLSIVTINYNNSDGLANTISSVFDQIWQEFEYIIVDGGSKDGSLDLIKKNQDKLAYWISEPDNGIYHAMNKGIAEAKGEYLLMLNAGDLLSGNTVLEQVFGSTNVFEEDILSGNVYRAENGKIFSESTFPNELSFEFLRNGTLSHQATFIRRRLHDIVGLYDENLKFSSDWKFFILAICSYNASYRHLPFFVAVCDCTGLTCRPENFSAMKRESILVLKTYFPEYINDDNRFGSSQLQYINQIFSRLWLRARYYVKKLIA